MSLTEWLLLGILLVLMDMAGYLTLIRSVAQTVWFALLNVARDSMPGRRYWTFLVAFAALLMGLGELSVRGLLPQWMYFSL